MNTPEDYQLSSDQTDSPILYHSGIDLSKTVTLADMRKIFPGKSHQLTTWSKDFRGCHYIGVQHETPMHTDPKCPRYSYQIILYCDGFGIQGLNKKPVSVWPEQFIELDTHSPHQLVEMQDSAQYYLAASFDSHVRADRQKIATMLTSFLMQTQIYK